jgi:hypothetical protein
VGFFKFWDRIGYKPYISELAAQEYIFSLKSIYPPKAGIKNKKSCPFENKFLVI